MTSLTEDVESLLRLARDKSIEGRKRLVEVVSDIYFDRDTAVTARERALMTDILRKLINDVATPVRKALAERLASRPEAPHEVVIALAEDEIDVARPILLKSEALLDVELIEIIRHRTLEHQLAIAMRRSVSETVSDALVETGSVDVIKMLLENANAKITEATMAYLVDQSRTVDSFQEPLLRRQDLSPRLAKKMYMWVSAALREYIAHRFQIDPATLDDAIEAAAVEAVGTITEQKPGVQEESKPQQLARHLRETAQITPELMVHTLRQGEVPLFEAMFAEVTGLRLALVRRLLFEPGGEGLAIACRGIDIPKPVFASIFLLSRKARPSDRAMDPRELSRVLALFDQIKLASAEAVLARWRRDPDYLYAIKTIEEAKGGTARA